MQDKHADIVARLRDTLITDADVATLTETFRVLGDATRIRVLDALAHAELCVRDLAALLDLSESAVSHQLRLLRSLRLVRPRRDGRLMFYALDDQHVVDLFREGLAHVGESARTGRAMFRPAGRSSGSPGIRREAVRPEDDSDGFIRSGRRCE